MDELSAVRGERGEVMKIKIYDYDDYPFTVDIGELEEIKELDVDVITGDEILTVWYTDGTIARFDSSRTRMLAFFDGCYVVENNQIEEWANFKFDSERQTPYAYQRMSWAQENLSF